jgi:hypothetical protein
MGPEAKLYQKLKKNFIGFSLIRLENLSLLGTVQALGPWSPNTYYMYRGSRIRELVTQGLKLDACYLGLEACRLALAELGA